MLERCREVANDVLVVVNEELLEDVQRMRTDIDRLDAEIRQLRESVTTITNQSLKVLAAAALVLAVIINIGWKALGA